VVKHSPDQCHQAVIGIKKLIEQISRIDDLEIKRHICDSAIEICDNLLRESKSVKDGI